jgi:RNA recognition motif-containing protein
LSQNIYVGNLSYSVTEDSLKELFEAYGAVESVKIITDNYTGRSKGFGFVVMASNEEADKAIRELDGNEFDGRNIKVNVARQREERGSTQGGGGNDNRRNSYQKRY